MDGSEDLLLVTQSGILIRTAVENIRIAGRATQGVIVMRFKEEGDQVISLALADKDENEETMQALDGVPDAPEEEKPDEETMEAMEDVREGNNMDETVSSVQELKEAPNSDD